jgi:D-arabinose 1-dehydrogenase-like Zn-dependent alcohol dehydrogenase
MRLRSPRTPLSCETVALPQANYPVTPGHEIVGRVCARGPDGGYATQVVADARFCLAIPALWGERSIASVANLTRADGHDFMEVAARIRLRPAVECFALQQADEVLESLRQGKLRGAAVLRNS